VDGLAAQAAIAQVHARRGVVDLSAVVVTARDDDAKWNEQKCGQKSLMEPHWGSRALRIGIAGITRVASVTRVCVRTCVDRVRIAAAREPGDGEHEAAIVEVLT